jgi:hypothetical protein
MPTLKTVRTKALEIAFLADGPATGWPVVLAHGSAFDAPRDAHFPGYNSLEILS